MEVIKKMDEKYVLEFEDALAIMKAILGERFIEYLFPVDDDGNVVLDFKDQRINFTAHCLIQVFISRLPYSLRDPSYLPYAQYFSKTEHGDIPVVEAYRRSFGGSSYSLPETQDALEAFPRKRLLSFYPSTLFKPQQEQVPYFGLIAPLFATEPESHKQYEKLFYDDFAVRTLLLQHGVDPDDDKSRKQALVSFNVPCQLNFFPLLVEQATLLNSVYSAWLKKNNPSYIDVTNELSHSLSIARAVLRGEQCQIPAILVFSGIDARALEYAQINNGIFRNPNLFEKNYLLPVDLNNVAIFETQCPLYTIQVSNQSTRDDASCLDGMTKALMNDPTTQNLWKTAEKIRLAILLASEGAMNPVYCGSYISSPVCLRSPSISSPGLTNQGNSEENFVINTEQFQYWYELLEKVHLPEISIERFLRAFSERSNIEDSVIDLFIAVECVFGTKTELQFKISAVVATILFPCNEAKRKETFKAFKMLYNLRSEIVHGNSGKRNDNDRFDNVNLLKKYVLKLFKALLTDFSWVLERKPEKRIEEVLLRDYTTVACQK